MPHTFLTLAIKKSRQSAAEGNFPAGAVVEKNGAVLASAVSSPYPGLLHADSKAVTEASAQHGVLTGATLYVGLEPCLMCTGVAYWAGIRRIVYAVPKSAVSGDYYETPHDTRAVVAGFNEPMDIAPSPAHEAEALAVVREWEAKTFGK